LRGYSCFCSLVSLRNLFCGAIFSTGSPSTRILVCGNNSLGGVCMSASAQRGRIDLGIGIRWCRRHSLLHQPLVYQVTVLGRRIHAGWDWGQSYFYGTPNSGLVMKGHFLASHPTAIHLEWGAAGPEASAYLLPLFVLAALSMCLWWGRMKNPRTHKGSLASLGNL